MKSLLHHVNHGGCSSCKCCGENPFILHSEKCYRDCQWPLHAEPLFRAHLCNLVERWAHTKHAATGVTKLLPKCLLSILRYMYMLENSFRILHDHSRSQCLECCFVYLFNKGSFVRSHLRSFWFICSGIHIVHADI